VQLDILEGYIVSTFTQHKLCYTIAEAEYELGISHAKLYELIQKHKLKTYMVGRRRYISLGAMNDFISAREAEAI